LEERDDMNKKEEERGDTAEPKKQHPTGYWKTLLSLAWLEEEEEEMKQYYNVAVYKVLPYPPQTKDVKDFFMQKT
jgi:hypothetical protein